MVNSPAVSVILPVFNAAGYLCRSVESILQQSQTDIEILIYDDGSTDGCAELLEQYQDARIRFHVSPKNCGYVYWLNVGLEEARGEFIARMDADDVAHPERLAIQIAAFQADTKLVLVGTNTRWIDGEEKVLQQKCYPENDVAIRWELLFDNPFCHPTTMMRGDVVRQHGLRYDASLMPSEDYRFWVELLRYGRGINVQQPLLDYRVHGGQISQTKRQRQLRHHDAVVRQVLADWPECAFSAPLLLAMREVWQGALVSQLANQVRLLEVAWAVCQLMQCFSQRFGSDVVADVVRPRVIEVWRRLFWKEASVSGRLNVLVSVIVSGLMISCWSKK